jgi:hypothetical protein
MPPRKLHDAAGALVAVLASAAIPAAVICAMGSPAPAVAVAVAVAVVSTFYALTHKGPH